MRKFLPTPEKPKNRLLSEFVINNYNDLLRQIEPLTIWYAPNKDASDNMWYILNLELKGIIHDINLLRKRFNDPFPIGKEFLEDLD